VPVSPDTVAEVLRRLTACRKRSNHLAARVVQLEQSRDMWKRRALAYRRRNYALVQKRRRRRPKPWTDGLTDSQIQQTLEDHHRIIDRILTIPPRDIQ
jgi:hypothetical protein